MAARRRLDAEMVRRGLVESRTKAQALIESGVVTVGGAPTTKAARQVDAGESIVVAGPKARFVSRGGEKLDAALEQFGVDVEGLTVLDAGASTGGFTDCVLQRGAAHVDAVDVGYGQLHERLRVDPRVANLERTNVRELTPDHLDGEADATVADLSFISLGKVIEALMRCTVAGGPLVLLVKPQFEAGRQEVSRGRGVISDPVVWRRTLGDACGAVLGAGGAIMGAMVSPLKGADGNVEFLIHARCGAADGLDPATLGALLDAVVASAAGNDRATGAEGATETGPT